MRVTSRVALIVGLLLVLTAPATFADHLTGECALTPVAVNPPGSQFIQSPHGVFRSGSQVFVLRGQTLSTYNVTDLGDLSIAREDFIGSLGARETEGGTAFADGFLYVSSEAGLEIYDLRNVRSGGNAPLLVSRTPGLHYRRLAVSGNILAALYPATDLPCYPTGTLACHNEIDIYSIANRNSPFRISQITSFGNTALGWNDIVFNSGLLVAVGEGGTQIYNLANPSVPSNIGFPGRPGRFAVSNGSTLLGIGDDTSILVYIFSAFSPSGLILSPFATYTPPFEQINRANPIVFHRQAWFDDQNGRLITLINEQDPLTLKPARTIAFDVYDFTVPMYEGSDQRGYETVSYVTPDEVKHNPVAIGPNVYVVGERSGLQIYGACGQMVGRVEWDGTQALSCGGAEIHGWVTGTQKITNVEVFLDNGSLGAALMTGAPRTDIVSRTPVSHWRIGVNLDQTPRGEHTLRLVGTDAFGNRRQFASQRIFFNGPGQNCTNRRQRTSSSR